MFETRTSVLFRLLYCDSLNPPGKWKNGRVRIALRLTGTQRAEIVIEPSHACKIHFCSLCTGPGKLGHIVEDTLLPMMFLRLRTPGNICCGHKMFLNKIRNIFCLPDTKFVSATNVARAGKRGNICVGNNVSATMCPRLPHQSNRSSNIPPGNPPSIWIFEKFLFKFHSPRAEKLFKRPHPRENYQITV